MVRRPISFWRYCLNQELMALAVALGVFSTVGWLAGQELNRRYLNLHRADADRVQFHLQEHISGALQRFQAIRSLPAEARSQAANLFLLNFSDLYRLDLETKVLEVIKSKPGSRVFQGFSFSASPIAPYVRQQLRSGEKPTLGNPEPSAVIRAPEDEIASIYLALGDRDQTSVLLGRLNLDFIQKFMRRFAAISGSPLLLVSPDGLVMLSSHPDLPIASIDLNAARSNGFVRPIQVGSVRWLPVAGGSDGLGSAFVTLVPVQPMEHQRQVLAISMLAVSLLLMTIFMLKTRRLHANLFNPVRTFAEQLRQVESGEPAGAGSTIPQERKLALAANRFLEISLIQEQFTAMVAAIQLREKELRQALRASLAAAAVGHEIKQPLSTIRLLCQQANRSDTSAGLRPLLSQLDRESGRVASTVESMRMLLRNVQSNQEPLDLADAASNAIAFTHHQRRSLGVVFQAEGLNGLPLAESPLPVIGDPLQLQIAIANLLRNGAEAAASMAPEQRRLRLQLQRLPASADHPHGLAGVQVADSGPGLPGQDGSEGGRDPGRDLGRHPLHTTKASGSGLGLFVVRTTLEQHGGWLQAGRSAELGGAAVSLWLPLRPPREA
jgi:signal transduction histidine kinase